MSYENNRIINYLLRTGLIIQASKTTTSVYFHCKSFTVRYSNHNKEEIRNAYLDIIYKSGRIKIKPPGKRCYENYSLLHGFYVLRRLIKKERKFEDAEIYDLYSKTAEYNFCRDKKRKRDKTQTKLHLNSLKGISLSEYKKIYLEILKSLDILFCLVRLNIIFWVNHQVSLTFTMNQCFH